ncbi:hypothetical protein A2U01_0058646, partial [Trifolium medium]|nr:hypothetical protein [Trifolium medium]
KNFNSGDWAYGTPTCYGGVDGCLILVR